MAEKVIEEKMTTEEGLSYAFVFSSVIIIAILVLFSLFQDLEECSQVDLDKGLKNAGESVCFIGKNGEKVEITLSLRGHYEVYFRHSNWLKFKLCKSGRCRMIRLTGPQEVHIGEIRVPVSGYDGVHSIKNLYAYILADGNELKFKLKPG